MITNDNSPVMWCPVCVGMGIDRGLCVFRKDSDDNMDIVGVD